MAGGNWELQDKIRPGVYIRFQTKEGLGLQAGSRGTAAICEPMSWGPVGTVLTVEAGEDTTPFCGYPITAPQARFLQQIFLGTSRTSGPKKLYLYRPTATSSAQASAQISPLTITAKYPGVRGNDITVSVTAIADEEDQFLVTTMVDGTVADRQTAAQVSDLKANDWVLFSGEGALSANAGTPLTSGADGTVEAAAYASFLTAIEPYAFDMLIYDGKDSATLTAMKGFVERMCEEEGRYTQLTASFETPADSPYVINVASGMVLADGVALTPQQACWWVGGAQAGASYKESLTYASHPQAVAPDPVLTGSQAEKALQEGKLVLTADFDTVRIEQDINSLTTFTPSRGKAFHKNRVIRLLNSIANDVYRQFSTGFIGVVNNNADGRSLFKGAVVGYLLGLQQQQAIQNFTAEDVQVLAGEEIDSIVIDLAVQPVDSVEKIYMTVTVS